MIVLTNVAVADEPAQIAIRKPRLMTSARPLCNTSCSIGWITSSTTCLLKAESRVLSRRASVRSTVVAPNQREA